jgi:paraquat-inducible protein B
MKMHVSPAVVGAFVIGACSLAVAALLFFGGVSFFHKPQRFVVYFNESAQGLNLGSAVKLQGVGVGRVVDLNIIYDQPRNRSEVAVTCEFDQNAVRSEKGEAIDVSDRGQLQTLVDRGLRAELGVVGLATGLLYVELDFLDPKEFPADGRHPEAKYPVVPSTPSTISEFQSNATEILTKIRRVDFEGLANDLKGLLADIRKQVDAADLKGLTAQWRKTGASLDALANSPEIKQSFANLDATLASVRSALGDLHHTLSQVDTQVAADSTSLQSALKRTEATLEQFDAAAVTVRRFVDSQQNLGGDADAALRQLTDAAASVERLADFLERNPSALVSGRKPPP